MSRLTRLLEAVRPHYEHNDPGHDLPHVLRVTRLAQCIAREEGGDVEVILPAALCHDLRRWESTSHGKETTAFIAGLLRQVGYEDPEIERITRAVQRHSFTAPAPPCSLEEKILFDADKLEGLGAIGIGRCFAVSGALGQAIFGTSGAGVTAQRMLSERLSRSYERLHTATARKLGKPRLDFLLGFIEHLESELELAESREDPGGAMPATSL